MKELKCMHYEEISDVFFPSLETLVLAWCSNLRGWQRLGDDNEANYIDSHVSLPPFPRLSSLKISDCPNLICMPTLSKPVKNLSFVRSSAKLMMEKCLVQFESSPSCPLSALKDLEIGEVTEIEAMAEDWMQNLTSLECLSLWGSSIIQPLLRHLQHLPTQLKELLIKWVDDDKLDLWKDGEDNSTQCHGPPHGLRSLQKFSTEYCGNIKALPEQIGDLQSLRHIEIVGCHKLKSLPEAMCCLTNLQTLRIIYCPLLHDRCQAAIGQDWPKIAHIPNILID